MENASLRSAAASLLLFWHSIVLAGCDASANPSSNHGTSDTQCSQPHPRTLSGNEGSRSVSRQTIERLTKNLLSPPSPEPDLDAVRQRMSIDREGAMRQIVHAANTEEANTLLAAHLWRTTRDPSALREAKRRVLHLSSWNPRGPTGFLFHDQAGRSVAWTLALAYDWLYDQWTDDERSRLLRAIKPRVEDMLSAPVKDQPTGWAALDWGKKLDRWPFDSHGVTAMGRLSVICSVFAGEDPLFDKCAKEILPRYIARPIPWGGTDGGFANGTAYAHWGLLDTHFIVWHLLKNATGTDLWQTGWAKGYLNFMAYFLPPGAPTGLFGDGAEQRHAGVWATQARAYAAALPSPLADWYARNQFGENPLHLALLLAPARDWNAIPGTLPPGTPHAMHLADTGWVAMHSDLGDRARTSVYFKSSPYGSYNHSHADQNAFVVHARGRVLAADSGYYDAYGSPHWRDWYKQTRAHNAITFDGGQGQLHDSMEAKGKIIRFEHHADHDIVTGDATAAYGGALTRALRSIVYLRPDTVLVYDSLASKTPRTWEWNLHALSRMKEKGPRELEIEQDGVRMCVRLLDAPEGAFSQTDRFTAEPQGDHPRQWHARYASSQNTVEARFLALLDIGCGQPSLVLNTVGSIPVLHVGGRQLRLLGGGLVEVAR